METNEPVVDILVIGGGVNGAGIARDAAGRGLSVMLVEQNDLAGATSAASSKLIHGGLRYLEQNAFRLVREALIEREVLLRAAPHLIRPLRFVLPHDRGLRPAWMIRLGLFLYDHLGGKGRGPGRGRLPGSGGLDLRRDPAGAPLRPTFVKGFHYADCWVDDARLVVLNALDARERGADIRTHTRLVAAARHGGRWVARIADETGGESTVTTRALVNAAGPWVADVLTTRTGLTSRRRTRLVKGSHIVVPRLHDRDDAYILQNDDRRVIFLLPFAGAYSLIGTTDVDFHGDAAHPTASAEEIAYLCRAVNRYFKSETTPDQVVWSFAGVRPLYEEAGNGDRRAASTVTRGYALDIDGGDGEAPALSVFGGKITTYRRLAEQAVDKLAARLGNARPAWTAGAPLPGGDLAPADGAGSEIDGLVATLANRYPWLPRDVARRYAQAYGSRVFALLDDARRVADLGRDFGHGLFEVEVRYMINHEWARTAEDVLWRRSKLGLRLSTAEAERLAAWMKTARTGNVEAETAK